MVLWFVTPIPFDWWPLVVTLAVGITEVVVALLRAVCNVTRRTALKNGWRKGANTDSDYLRWQGGFPVICVLAIFRRSIRCSILAIFTSMFLFRYNTSLPSLPLAWWIGLYATVPREAGPTSTSVGMAECEGISRLPKTLFSILRSSWRWKEPSFLADSLVSVPSPPVFSLPSNLFSTIITLKSFSMLLVLSLSLYCSADSVCSCCQTQQNFYSRLELWNQCFLSRRPQWFSYRTNCGAWALQHQSWLHV